MTEKRYVYVASFNSQGGEPSLTKAILVKETPKTFVFSRNSEDKESLLPAFLYIFSRISKNDEKYYVTKVKVEALAWLLKKTSNYIKREKAALERTKETKEQLEVTFLLALS